MIKMTRFKIALLACLSAAALSSGCGSSRNFVFTGSVPEPIEEQPVALAPVAVDDAVNALGNATLNQAAATGVLTNDTLNGATITEFDATTTQGGTVTLNADGSFAYTAPLSFTGNDTFTYTLGNDGGSSTATVTLNINALGFFVDNSGPNGNGSQASPFNNLTDALGAVGSGDTIFVYSGDGTNTNQSGPFTLPAGVNLIGQAEGLIVAQTIEAPGSRPVLQGPITLSGDNTVAGFRMENSATVFLTATGVENLTVDNNEFAAPTNQHITLTDIGGTVNITDNVFGPHAAATDVDYVEFVNNNTNATIVATGNTFTDDATSNPDDGFSITLNGTSDVTATFELNTFTGQDLNSAFRNGIDFVANNTTQVNLIIDTNSFTNGDRFLSLNSTGGSAVIASITGNTSDGCDIDTIRIDAESTVTTEVIFTGNVISNSGQSGFDIDCEGSTGSFRALIENNTISTSDQEDVVVNGDGENDSFVFIRANTLNGVNDSLRLIKDSNSHLCADITGNIVVDNMVFEDDGGTGELRVEQFDLGTGGPLSSVNTFNPPAAAVEANGAGSDVTPVVDNACGAP